MTNLSIPALNQMSDAVAHATLAYAEDDELFVGRRSRVAGSRSAAYDAYDAYKGPLARR